MSSKFQKQIEKALLKYVPIWKERMSRGNGKPWFTKSESFEIQDTYAIPGQALATVYNLAATELRVERIEKRPDHQGEEFGTMAVLLDGTDGEITDEIMELFREKHPDFRFRAWFTKAVKKSLGLEGSDNGKTAKVQQIAGLGDATRMFAEYQKLIQQEVDLEEKLSDVQEQLRKYKAVAAALRGLREAVEKTKQQAREEVSQSLTT